MKRFTYLLVALVGFGVLLSNATTASAQPHYAVVFDVSGSISNNQLNSAKPVTRTYVTLRSAFGHNGRIKSFSSAGTVPTNLCAWTATAGVLVGAVNGINNTGGLTALYDAMVEAANDLGAQGGATGRDLICFTDGLDNNSTATANSVLLTCLANGVVPYALVYPASSEPSKATIDVANEKADVGEFVDAVEQAGGKVYYINSSTDAYNAIRDIGHMQEVPSMTPLGLFILIGLLVATAIYWIMRRKVPVSI